MADESDGSFDDITAFVIPLQAIVTQNNSGSADQDKVSIPNE